jgi:hypothetical protein
MILISPAKFVRVFPHLAGKIELTSATNMAVRGLEVPYGHG